MMGLYDAESCCYHVTEDYLYITAHAVFQLSYTTSSLLLIIFIHIIFNICLKIHILFICETTCHVTKTP